MSEIIYKIRYLPLAKEDLQAIKAYLSQFYSSTSKKVMSEIKQKINALPTQPNMYEEYQDDHFYRRMVVSNYLVFYHVNERTEFLDIHRILRGSWNVRQYLEENKH